MEQKKIYKYTSFETGMKILNGGCVLLNNPHSFNDLFDCLFIEDSEDIEKTNKIIKEFSLITEALLLFLQCDKTRMSEKERNALNFLNHKIRELKRVLRIRPFFEGLFDLKPFADAIRILVPNIDKEFETLIEQHKKMIQSSINKMADNTIVSCFSKKKDSVLMWGHYADKHKGICIEYNRPEDVEFYDVEYKKEMPKIKMFNMISFIIAESILNEDTHRNLNLIFKDVIRPSHVKSIDWDYEDEVRCICSKEQQDKSKLIIEEDKYYYKMSKPTAIYIGCNAGSKAKKEVVNFAKKHKIKYFFMKKDTTFYKLLPN